MKEHDTENGQPVRLVLDDNLAVAWVKEERQVGRANAE
jgi:hypothetical protein